MNPDPINRPKDEWDGRAEKVEAADYIVARVLIWLVSLGVLVLFIWGAFR